MKLELYFPKESDTLFPFFTIPIPAGKAQEIDQVVEWIDLNDFVRRGADPVYYLRVNGDSMEESIYHGDLLVVRRVENAETGDIVVAEINGEFTVKTLRKQDRGLYLVPNNGEYQTVKVGRRDMFAVWGIVDFVIRSTRKKC